MSKPKIPSEVPGFGDSGMHFGEPEVPQLARVAHVHNGSAVPHALIPYYPRSVFSDEVDMSRFRIGSLTGSHFPGNTAGEKLVPDILMSGEESDADDKRTKGQANIESERLDSKPRNDETSSDDPLQSELELPEGTEEKRVSGTAKEILGTRDPRFDVFKSVPSDFGLTTSEPGFRPIYAVGKIEKEGLMKVQVLLDENSLEAHKEALRMLEGMGLLASQRWEDIHNSKEHNFSGVGRKVNPFAQLVASSVDLNKDSIILELGSGFGNDAAYFARKTGAQVLAVDASAAAVSASEHYIESVRKLKHRITVDCQDFLPLIRSMEGANIDMVYSHSTLHYSSPMVLEQEIFPRLAAMLRREDRHLEPGVLCFAMKTSNSASAKSPNQMRLAQNEYNPSLDLRDRVFRIYPSVDKILEMVEQSFTIRYFEVKQVEGYDRNGETEEFAYFFGQPKLAA